MCGSLIATEWPLQLPSYTNPQAPPPIVLILKTSRRASFQLNFKSFPLCSEARRGDWLPRKVSPSTVLRLLFFSVSVFRSLRRSSTFFFSKASSTSSCCRLLLSVSSWREICLTCSWTWDVRSSGELSSSGNFLPSLSKSTCFAAFSLSVSSCCSESFSFSFPRRCL